MHSELRSHTIGNPTINLYHIDGHYPRNECGCIDSRKGAPPVAPHTYYTNHDPADDQSAVTHTGVGAGGAQSVVSHGWGLDTSRIGAGDSVSQCGGVPAATPPSVISRGGLTVLSGMHQSSLAGRRASGGNLDKEDKDSHIDWEDDASIRELEPIDCNGRLIPRGLLYYHDRPIDDYFRSYVKEVGLLLEV